ncbi:dynamin-binding protein [Microplitis demolitor]|uniref:dynamin-binding protein n=1 Tax=Microplitis demolitor TaxID=69319 RepID=UPI0004CCB6F7|nr:dynamin-binding protein [Microplitis demolitor]
MEAGLLTKVINDFLTIVDGELSLSKGDYFLIYNVIDKHWCYGESYGKRGTFPSNHLHKVDIPYFKDTEKLFVSIAPFNGEQDGDLSFAEGELIIGVQQVDTDWYSGYIDSRTGLFPLTHVWLINSAALKKPTDKKKVRRKARVKTSLKAQLDEELDLTAGEIVTVLEILEDGWVRGVTGDGREGSFPQGFVSYIEEDQESAADESDRASALNITMDPFPDSVAQGGKIFKDFNQSVPSTSTRMSVDNEPAPSYYDLFPETRPTCQVNGSSDFNIDIDNDNNAQLNSLGLKPYAITLYPFNAQFPNELNFEAGQVVHLIRHIDSEWAEGEIENEKGIFPTTYVNIIVNCSSSDVSQVENNEQEQPKDYQHLNSGDLVRVQHTFNAQMNGDLSVAEGDVLTVVEMANDDWVSVKNKFGDIGLCPRGYLTHTDTQETQEAQDPIVKHDSVEDFVVIRDVEKTEAQEEQRTKRLSEPHRPAPPAPAPGSVPLQKQSVADKTQPPVAESSNKTDETSEAEAAKQKRADKRQNVISELVITEKEFVRDLKVTYETFHLFNPKILEERGIDVPLLFGNILEVIHVAEELLDSLLKAMKGCDESKQMISPCFLTMADRLQTVYGKYCSNHEAALSLLKKYEENREIMKIFEKGIETLRYQVACFDMSSILIKPVQRILKYPLMLYELTKCTEDEHPDRAGIEAAWKAMTDVASYINEYKRRKDIVSKYLDTDNTLMSKMAKLSMHSVAKKSSRLSAKLSASLGLTNVPADPVFEELEKQFKSMAKCVEQLIIDIDQCFIWLNDDASCGELLAEYINQYHSGVYSIEVQKYNQVRCSISNQFIKTFKDNIDKSVIKPLSSLLLLLEGPEMLITKRYDKLLDYDNAISRSEKNKESRIINEELITAKTNYEALNQQLSEELPILIDAGVKITISCLRSFTKARKLFNGKVTKQYLDLPKSTTQNPSEDILQSFLINHNLLWNQISRFSFAGVNPRVEEPSADVSPQKDKHKTQLLGKYQRDKLFIVKDNLVSTSTLDLGASKGTIVAVIKTQDPMGDSSRWFVDNGFTQGFMPSKMLEALTQTKINFNNNYNNNDVVDSRSNTPDLMSLESPVKNVNTNLISLDSPQKVSLSHSHPNSNSNSNSQSQWYLNTEGINNDNKYYGNLPAKQEQRYENFDTKFYYVEFDFDGKMPGTLGVKKGQALKLIRPNDEKGNTAWWLMENRDGKSGYVPSNYLNLYRT